MQDSDNTEEIPTTPFPVVVMTQPTRRFDYTLDMIPELLTLGNNLYTLLDKMNERIFVVISGLNSLLYLLTLSGDLAHTHEADGPYGYSPAAEPFDEAMGAWASTLDREELLVTAASYEDDALSCG